MRKLLLAVLGLAVFIVAAHATTFTTMPLAVTVVQADGANGCGGWQKDNTYVNGNYYNHGWTGWCSSGVGTSGFYSGSDVRSCWGCGGNSIDSLSNSLYQWGCTDDLIWDGGLTVYSDYQVANNFHTYSNCVVGEGNGTNTLSGVYSWYHDERGF